MSRQVLVIDGNAGLVANLFGYLEPRGYVLDVARDGAAGLKLATSGNYHAIVLDWMLPRMDGATVVRKLREGGATLPVLMLSARDEIEDKVTAFRAGADDFLTKPFALAELEVRLESLMTRAHGRHGSVLRVGDLQFNVATRSARREASEIQLYSAIANLLEILMKASPSVVARQVLESVVWGDSIPDHDLLRAHMYELRKRVDRPFSNKLIHTVPKLGYRIAASDPPAR
jgi:DNA-binding response OmpR family regulator